MLHTAVVDLSGDQRTTPVFPAANASSPAWKSASVRPSGVRTHVTPAQFVATSRQLSPYVQSSQKIISENATPLSFWRAGKWERPLFPGSAQAHGARTG